MFRDCISEKDKNEYKTSKKLQEEVESWLKQNDSDFYRIQRLGTFCDVFEKICERIHIPNTDERFLHFIDYRYLFDTTRGYRFENITPNYRYIIENGLKGLKYKKEDVTNQFCLDYNRTIDSLICLASRIAKHEDERNTERSIIRAQYFRDMISMPARNFEEGLQRILFFHQMFWQMGQRLMGLGHCDILLYDIYKDDIQSGRLTRDEAANILADFFESLHQYCWLKSNMLLGDTGQIIILGTRGNDGQYICNDLTYLFVEVTEKKCLPDPKILLRVSHDTPKTLIQVALKCMQKGIGSPILANDDIIIPKLINFGVPVEDANQYGVAACWEPLIPGKSISPNNMKSIAFPKVMQRVWQREDLERLDNLDKWMEAFYEELNREIENIIGIISEARFQYNPYLSLFMQKCFEQKKDVSYGGAVYNNYGLTTVGLANTVNAIFNLKKYVFEQHEYTLTEVKQILESNFAGYEELRVKLKNSNLKYGMDEPEVLNLTNEILRRTSKMISRFRNYMGGRLKIGVSSPSYIDAAEDVLASFDGRGLGEPFAVHISSERNNGYTEIINFASQLDYCENRFNGNVVDIMVAPSFIESNFDKMLDFIQVSIAVGFFQLQMNVIDSNTLIEAKQNPGKFPNLIVRVWGFSAYFMDLPEDYQNVLIERAIENERRA